ncbi:MAG: hypothetical protein LC713_03750, partial [Actinobacteria bacterium]|nr:hypothetical protein [Actinomycetota bacterium]
TDIGKRLQLSPEEADAAVQRALLGISDLNRRIEDMESYEAVVGFRGQELPIVEKKFEFLVNQFYPEAQEARFGRVIAIADLPDPESAPGSVNVEKLLDARESQELREFRQWLRTLDNATDAEIADMVASIGTKVSEAVHSPRGKTVRFVVTTLAGLIPIHFAGVVAGPALSAIDQFLLDKVIPEPGPVSFLGSSYPSIFD